MRDWGRYLYAMVLLTVAYGLASVLGLNWAAVSGAGSPVWPAAGVALASLLLGGVRLWPAIVIGRLAAGLVSGSEQPFWAELAIAFGNALAAVLVASLLRGHARIDLRLAAMRDVLWLSVGSGLGAAVSGLIGTGVLWLSAGLGPERAVIVGSTWWFSNMVGTLVPAALILAWSEPSARALTKAAWLHLTAPLAATVIVSSLIFLSSIPYLSTWHVFPALIWISLAFHVRGASIALLISSGSAIWGTTIGIGPFLTFADNLPERLLFAQQFASIAAFTVLILAAAADERRGKEALGRSEERFRELADNISQLVWTADADGRINWFNRRWSDYTGMTSREPQGVDWSLLSHPDYGGCIAKRMAEAFHTGQPWEDTFPMRGRDGEYRWFLSRALPIRDEEGRVVRWLGTYTDVTELHKAEEALRGLNAELERKVEERSSELVQLQKLESIGRLTGGIAHDFNNLLMVVVTSMELLTKRLREGDIQAARLVDNAMQAAQRGVALTQRMLAFARKQELKPEPVSVPDLVIGMTDLLTRSIGPHIKVETRFSLGLSKAMVDANQLELAILNLAVNARDAMPEGGVLTIDVSETRIGQGGALSMGTYIRLCVTDTGAGMDEATLNRAMEPFFTTKGVGKGTGLGLSMVKGLAVQSGGEFMLKSEPGRGTRAEILLPAAKTWTEAADAALPVPVTTADMQPPGRKLSVLLVDDDALVLIGTAQMVEDLGHEAVEASSGSKAVEMLRCGHAVDVVITDQAMPGMTGMELAATIRKEWPWLPVILASGYAELPEGVEGVITERINKPFRQKELATALARAAGAGKVVSFRSQRSAVGVGTPA